MSWVLWMYIANSDISFPHSVYETREQCYSAFYSYLEKDIPAEHCTYSKLVDKDSK